MEVVYIEHEPGSQIKFYVVGDPTGLEMSRNGSPFSPVAFTTIDLGGGVRYVVIEPSVNATIVAFRAPGLTSLYVVRFIERTGHRVQFALDEIRRSLEVIERGIRRVTALVTP